MNALTKIENTALSAMTEQELVDVLQASLYPGAKLQSIKMVLGYCKAAGLDPMQKPVHIVPMKVSTGQKDDRGWDIKEDRDVIMPGVGLYRTQAARTGVYAGVSDPEFGPAKKLTFTSERWEEGENGRRQKRSFEESMEYPEWCRVSVTRIVDGQPREFSAREYWLENYATKGASSTEPNAMWKRRPFGQIAKCAEAQALRKAFPEMIGSQPTAEEMEGKQLDDQGDRTIDHSTGSITAGASGAATVTGQGASGTRTALPEMTADDLAKREAKVREFYGKGKTADEVIAFYGQKFVVPEAIQQRIRAMGSATPAAGQQVTDVAPKVPYPQVAERIAKATAADQIDEAETLIPAIQNPEHRTELTAKAKARRAELSQEG
jgi:phage recombination protein Bet